MIKLDTVNGYYGEGESGLLTPNNTSLVLFSQNRNGSNISTHPSGKLETLLIPFFADFFNGLGDIFKNTIPADFISPWRSQLDQTNDKLKKFLKKEYESSIKDNLNEHINLVMTKFKGNIGEIFAEYFFKLHATDICDTGTYSLVDPHHEEFIDAIAENNGQHIEIQIKNYSKYNLVKREVFAKASDQICRYMFSGKVDDPKDYLSSPKAFILSFSEVNSEEYLDTYHDVVSFLGPTYINGKHLHGNIKSKTHGRYRDFYDIANQIKNLEIRYLR